MYLNALIHEEAIFLHSDVKCADICAVLYANIRAAIYAAPYLQK